MCFWSWSLTALTLLVLLINFDNTSPLKSRPSFPYVNVISLTSTLQWAICLSEHSQNWVMTWLYSLLSCAGLQLVVKSKHRSTYDYVMTWISWSNRWRHYLSADAPLWPMQVCIMFLWSPDVTINWGQTLWQTERSIAFHSHTLLIQIVTLLQLQRNRIFALLNCYRSKPDFPRGRASQRWVTWLRHDVGLDRGKCLIYSQTFTLNFAVANVKHVTTTLGNMTGCLGF